MQRKNRAISFVARRSDAKLLIVQQLEPKQLLSGKLHLLDSFKNL
jgi:hypothetical protein